MCEQKQKSEELISIINQFYEEYESSLYAQIDFARNDLKILTLAHDKIELDDDQLNFLIKEAKELEDLLAILTAHNDKSEKLYKEALECAMQLVKWYGEKVISFREYYLSSDSEDVCPWPVNKE